MSHVLALHIYLYDQTKLRASWHVQLIATFTPPCFWIVLGSDRCSRRYRHVNRLARRALAALWGTPWRGWSGAAQNSPGQAWRVSLDFNRNRHLVLLGNFLWQPNPSHHLHDNLVDENPNLWFYYSTNLPPTKTWEQLCSREGKGREGREEYKYIT